MATLRPNSGSLSSELPQRFESIMTSGCADCSSPSVLQPLPEIASNRRLTGLKVRGVLQPSFVPFLNSISSHEGLTDKTFMLAPEAFQETFDISQEI